jgi:hypothetical protein|nr:MAG TPA: hypothetical protein [Caudoviricetes sp.]
MSNLDKLKIILREKDIPFFEDEDLKFYLAENNQNLNQTAYQCLIIKSENTTLNISGMTTADTSEYFKRLASRYRPRNSGILQGGC